MAHKESNMLFHFYLHHANFSHANETIVISKLLIFSIITNNSVLSAYISHILILHANMKIN